MPPRTKEPDLPQRRRIGAIEVVLAASYGDSNNHTTHVNATPDDFAEHSFPQNQTFRFDLAFRLG